MSTVRSLRPAAGLLAATTAILALLTPGAAAAENCSVEVVVGDGLSYSTDRIEAPASCETFEIVLVHEGSMPAAAMGHNWVLTRPEDLQAVASAGAGAGVAGDYLPAEDERILAATDLVGGGEETATTVDLAGLESGREYSYFCSFPGHWTVMKGTFVVR